MDYIVAIDFFSDVMTYMDGQRFAVIILLTLVYYRECTNLFQDIDKKYYLVSEAYLGARTLFAQSQSNYDSLKNMSLHVMDIFLDLVHIMNNEMAKELRSAIIKFYKIKYFHDFNNYIISLDEMTDIIEHCLIDPVEKIADLRQQFRSIIKNFQDVRQFETVNKCIDELPDEVAAAHCILHQAVLFNETMQDSLVSIVEIKTRQHARVMNTSLYDVQACLNNFVPHFFEQLIVDPYTERCGYLKVVNSSIYDLIKDKWRSSRDLLFPKKWSMLVGILKKNTFSSPRNTQHSLFMNIHN